MCIRAGDVEENVKYETQMEQVWKMMAFFKASEQLQQRERKDIMVEEVLMFLIKIQKYKTLSKHTHTHVLLNFCGSLPIIIRFNRLKRSLDQVYIEKKPI